MSETEVTRKEFDGFRKEFDDFKKTAKFGKPPKKTRAPSKFNIFVGDKIKEIKAKNPDMKHTLAFSQAVAAWKDEKK